MKTSSGPSNEEFLRKVATKVRHGQEATIEDTPSFAKVSGMPILRMEIESLLPVRVTSMNIRMSSVEIRTLIEANNRKPLSADECTEISGCAEGSIFDAIFEVA